ncbi:MAG: hypothetical protein WBR26_10525 [Candidatus Acidiferrum sp.]
MPMEIDLTRPPARLLLLAAVILCSGALTLFSGKAYLAAHWNNSANPGRWVSATRLEPANAEYWAHVGLSRQWDASPESTREAIRYLQQAVQINSRSADLWMDLADAYATSGDPIRTQDAYEKAQANYPISAEVAWRYGSFLLFEGEFARSYEQIRRAISNDPSLTQRAVAECWQANPNIATILNVLPAKSEYYLDAMDFFLSQRLSDPAVAVWNRWRKLKLPVELPNATPLVDALIEQKRVPEAQQTWIQAVQLSNWPRDPGGDGSVVWNGGFEHGFASGGFDWREVAVKDVRFDIDRFVAHSGSRSLRVQFDGTQNLDFQHLFQYVSVEPNTHYRFLAYIKTDQISTDRGICFEIVDPWHPSQVEVLTSDFKGTNTWMPVQAEIVTGPDTNLLEIVLRRVPSWKFDNKLSGTAWVDDIELKATKPSRKDNAG